ncbi:MAG TPA: anti-sigma factor [Gammaproteobacteria bacterium]
MNRGPISEADLHGYVDGALDPVRRRELEEYLAAHPTVAAQVDDYRRLNAVLHSSFDPVVDAPLPQRLVQRPRAPRRLAVAAVSAWLALGGVIGGVAGWQLHARSAGDAGAALELALARPAGVAHAVYAPEVLHPVEVVAAQQAHLVGWLSKRLGAPLHAPALDGLGYQLVGGRLLPASDGPAAQLMYQDSAGRRLTLYVRSGVSDNRDTAFRFAEQDGLGVFYWVDGPFGYALSAPLTRDQLLPVAQTVYSALNP